MRERAFEEKDNQKRLHKRIILIDRILMMIKKRPLSNVFDFRYNTSECLTNQNKWTNKGYLIFGTIIKANLILFKCDPYVFCLIFLVNITTKKQILVRKIL